MLTGLRVLHPRRFPVTVLAPSRRRAGVLLLLAPVPDGARTGPLLRGPGRPAQSATIR